MNGSRRLNVALWLFALLSVGCSDDDGPPADDGIPRIAIGALADRTGPSASQSYEHAITLATVQMNNALAQAGVDIRFDSIVRDSQSNTVVAQEAAVDLINNEDIKGIVTDVSANTVIVNQLNYDSATRALRRVPITCYACSSAFINDPTVVEMDPVRQEAERDVDNWLYRVFFNGKYEAAVSVRIMLHKENSGDVNRDGNFKVTVYAQDDPFGQSSAQSIKNATDQLAADQPHSVEIVYVPASTDPTTYDWSTDLARLVDDHNETTNEDDGKPDAVFLALLPLLATGVVSARSDLGYDDVPMQAATAFRRNYILRSILDKAVGLEGDSPRVYAQDDSGFAYANAFQAVNGDVPEMLSSHVYDCAVRLMLGTLKAAINLEDPTSVETTAIRDQMLSVTAASGEIVRSTPEGLARAVTVIKQGDPINYLGASGVGPWNPAGDTFPELVHWTVVNDGVLRFREEEAYVCSPDHPTCELIPETE